MTGITRTPVVAIPFANNRGATILCSDGSVWDLLYSDDGNVAWNDLGNPLPGSVAALSWKAPPPGRDSSAAIDGREERRTES